MFETKVDQLVAYAQKKKSVGLDNLAKHVQMPLETVELICAILEKGGILDVNYPISITEKPSISFRLLPMEPPKESDGPPKGKTLASYTFVADGVPASVTITDTEKEKDYTIALVEFGTATKIFLDLIKDELLRAVPTGAQSDVSDIEKAAKAKDDFKQLIINYLHQFQLGKEVNDVLVGMLLHKLFGLGEIEIINHDDWLEEIIINNSKSSIGVYHRRYGWLRTNIYMPDEEAIFNYSSQIARRVGRQIANLTPILDARLETGDRVCSTLAPISAHGNTITIRRFARNPWTIVNLVGNPGYSMTPEMAGMLWQAIHYEMNILVAGGTASGKTTALNALASFIPPNQRIITIEDTRELMLPPYQWNWVPLLTRNQNAEGLGEVSMLDLMTTSLRMRPDRIILGEMRRQREAEVLFEAMHTGHSVGATLHADTGIQTIRRLTSPPISLPPSELEAVHLIVVQYRDRRKNVRRTLEICEIVPGAVCIVGQFNCCSGLKCTNISKGENSTGTCCIVNAGDTFRNCWMNNALNNSACCSKKCEGSDYEGTGKCVSCWNTTGNDCNSAADCCSPGTVPFCALPVGATTQKQCLSCIPTSSLTNCTSSSQCCSGLCDRLNVSVNYSKCVSCLPETHVCTNNLQCCTGICQFDTSGTETGSDNFGAGHCAPPAPPCGRTGALCMNDSNCCTFVDPPLFCDKLNPVGIPIDPITGTGSGTQGDGWFGVGIAEEDSTGGSTSSSGSCKTCFETTTKCDGIHSCCDASANCTLPPSGGSTKYCLLPAAASPNYLFYSWMRVGSGSFTPDASNVHSGSASVKIESDVDGSYIYNTAFQSVLLGGRKYSLEFWAKADSGEGEDVDMTYAIFDASNQVYLNSSGAWETAADDGEPITISKLLSSNYERKVQDFSTLGGASIQIRFYTPSSGAYYLDDVLVTEINDFTMSAWVKASAGQANAASLFRQMGEEFGNDQGIDWFLTSDNQLTMKFYGTWEGGAASRAPTLDLSDGNWHHVTLAAIRTGNYYAYLDGALVSSGAFGLGRMNSSSPFLIGASDELGSNGFKGQIDEVRFYKRALSSQEVLNHFKGMYQDKCSMELTITYNRSTATGSMSTAYNAELRLKRQLPDSVLSLPFDISVDSDSQGAITDYSRLLQHATKTSAAWTSGGKIGGAYQFNAATDKITIPSSLLSGTGDFTLSAWVQPKTMGGTQRIMGNKLAADEGVSLYLSGNVPTLSVSGLSLSAPAISGEIWTHVAATRNNGVGRFYINGIEVARSNSMTGSLTSTGNFVIGNSPSSSEPFSGTIDEVNVFTRALSAGEIASLYNESVSVSSRSLITSQN